MYSRAGKVRVSESRAVADRALPKDMGRSGIAQFVDNRGLPPIAFSGMAKTYQLQNVDTSSSPFFPEYKKDEVPAWKQQRGVPKWARDQYCKDAKRTLIASVANGKIGSVYFEQGRIRTTHSHGPEEELHSGTNRLQFNIDIKAAEAEFERSHPNIEADIRDQIDDSLSRKQKNRLFSKLYYRACDGWIARRLNNLAVDSLPSWATRVSGPEKAIDLSKGAPSSDTILFEVFVSVSGEVQSWHPSRGVAAKFSTNKQVVSVLKAALKKLEDENITQPGARNVAFYKFIRSRLPGFVSKIRPPSEV